MNGHHWTLSPSDFAGLSDECRRCFYLRVARGFPRPVLASSELDARLKASCEGRRTETIAPDMPAGVLEIGERRVESDVLDVHLPDAVQRCVIRGTHDVIARLDDGGFAVIDLVTGAETTERLTARGRQLEACAYAFEHPSPDTPALGPIARLGVLVFAPEKFAADAGGVGTLSGGLTWVEMPRDAGGLFGFLAEALSLLEQPDPPGGTPLCPWCVYRDVSRRTGL